MVKFSTFKSTFTWYAPYQTYNTGTVKLTEEPYANTGLGCTPVFLVKLTEEPCIILTCGNKFWPSGLLPQSCRRLARSYSRSKQSRAWQKSTGGRRRNGLGLGVGQSKVEERPCNSEDRRKKNASLNISHRSRPDLSQHLPAVAFSPFDACLLPSTSPLYLSSVRRANGGSASGTASLQWSSLQLSIVVRAGASKRWTANACKEGNNVYKTASFFWTKNMASL